MVRWRDPARRQRSRAFRRKVDADRFARSVEVDIDRGQYVAPAGGRTLLVEWWARWWPTQVHLRPSTRARDESVWTARVAPVFGHRPVGAIARLEVGEWLAELQREGLSAEYVAKCHQVLGKALRAAVDEGLIGSSPADGLPLPTIERAELRILNPAEVDHLASTIDRRYALLVRAAAYSGLREGELFALRRGRVDLLRRTIQVVETAATVRGAVVFGPPKTRRARRTVPIPKVLAAELEPHVARLRPDELVFQSAEGTPVRASNFRRRYWTPAVDRAGLAPLRFHDLRHTAVSWWIHTGATPQQLTEWAGHSSVRTTFDVYGGLLPDSHDEVMGRLDNFAERRLGSVTEFGDRGAGPVGLY